MIIFLFYFSPEDDHDYYIADDIDDLEKASEKKEKERKKLLTILIPLITGTTMLMLGGEWNHFIYTVYITVCISSY